MAKKKIMKARGIRFEDRQWAYLNKNPKTTGSPSEKIRDLVDADMKNK